MNSPDVDHQTVLGNLFVAFKEFFKGKKCRPSTAPFDVHFRKKDIKDPDVLQPDLIVLCDMENNVNEKRRYMGTPTLTLEILSDGTRSRDMVYKLNTFMLSEYRNIGSSISNTKGSPCIPSWICRLIKWRSTKWVKLQNPLPSRA